MYLSTILILKNQNYFEIYSCRLNQMGYDWGKCFVIYIHTGIIFVVKMFFYHIKFWNKIKQQAVQ